MFDQFKNKIEQLQMMQRLMKDENFRAFMAHPKVQELFRDPEFIEIVKKQDTKKLLSHPRLAALKDYPELKEHLSKIKFQ